MHIDIKRGAIINHILLVTWLCLLFGCYWLCADEAIGVILKACIANGFNLLITADHGNAETMIDDNDNPVTKHTTNRGEL